MSFSVFYEYIYLFSSQGVPKGVMLTHGNIIADCTALDYFKNANLNNKVKYF